MSWSPYTNSPYELNVLKNSTSNNQATICCDKEAQPNVRNREFDEKKSIS